MFFSYMWSKIVTGRFNLDFNQLIELFPNTSKTSLSLDGFGPIGIKYCYLQECIVHDSLVEQTALLTLTIYRCSENESRV